MITANYEILKKMMQLHSFNCVSLLRESMMIFKKFPGKEGAASPEAFDGKGRGNQPAAAVPKRILVIEDNPTHLELMTLLLEAFNYTVIPAASGAEGIDLMHREKLDLIICDIQMPGLDGYDVAHHLKEDPLLHHLPLVAVTAMAMIGDCEKVLAAGFDGYIDKPITPEIFIYQVAAFTKRHS